MKFIKRNRVIVLATSPNTRGGIASVVKAHRMGEHWNRHKIKWIATHIDKGSFFKVLTFLNALIKFIYYLPETKIVHIHLSLVNSLKRKTIFIYIAKFFKIKVIIHFHPPGHNPEHLEGNLRETYHKVFSKADIIIVLSNYWLNWFSKEIGINKNVRVIYNPCPFVKPIKIERKKIILFAGSLIDRKGYKDLIKAFALTSKKHEGWNLVLAGNGEIEAGKFLASKLGIESKIVFTGWISGDEKIDLFSSCSIFCLPSYGEGFPMAILDAWSYGIPVISTKVGGLIDILQDGTNALTFNPGDIIDLSNKIDMMISDVNLRNSISQESVKLALNDFNLININQKIDALYAELYDNHA